MPKISSIRNFFIFLATLLFIVSMLGYWSFDLLKLEAQRENHALEVELYAKQITHIIEQRLGIVQIIAQNPKVQAVFAGGNRTNNIDVERFLNAANEVSKTDIIYLIDRHGNTIISTSSDEIRSVVGQNYRFRPYFQWAIMGKVTIYPAVGILLGTRGLHLSAPVYRTGETNPVGVIAMKINISEVEGLLLETRDKIAILSPEGIIFSSNQPAWLFKAIRPISSEVTAQLEKTRQFNRAPIASLGLNLAGGRISIDKQPYIVSRAPLPIAGWEIISCQLLSHQMPLPPLQKNLWGAALGITSGLAILIFFLLENIQQRRDTERMLRQAEDKYYGIFKNAVTGIYQSTLDGRFLEASPSMAHILGFDDPKQLIESINDINNEVYVDIDDRDEFLNIITAQGQISGFETRFYCKDRRIIWVSLTTRIATAFPGGEQYLEGACLDITEKRIALENLDRERDIFLRVMENNPVSITLMDHDGNITFANTQAEKCLGITKQSPDKDKYHQPNWQLTNLEGRQLENNELPTSLVLTTGKPVHDFSYVAHWPEGRKQILSMTIAPLIDQNGKVTEMVSVIDDITEKVRAEEEETLRQQQLFQVDRMVSMGVMAAGVAHEINNPNTFILSNSNVLKDAWKETKVILDEYYRENGDFFIGGILYSKYRENYPDICARIIDGSRRIKSIVKELGLFSRQDAIDFIEDVDVNTVILSAQILLSNMIKRSTEHFALDLDETIPMFRGNAQHLEQVIINIVQNACQALSEPSQGIFISTSYDAVTKEIEIVCQDEGCGISEEDIGHIEDPFFTTKRDCGGSGLGLSVSSTIVRMLKGTMKFKSLIGQGTKVTLRFPQGEGREESFSEGIIVT